VGGYSNEFKYTVCILHYACIVYLFLVKSSASLVGTARRIITLASFESPPLPTVTWQHPTRQHQLSNSASGLYPA